MSSMGHYKWLSEETLLTLLLATEVGPPAKTSDWLAECNAVLSVVYNRVRSRKREFKKYKTVHDVVLAPYQFSAVGSHNWTVTGSVALRRHESKEAALLLRCNEVVRSFNDSCRTDRIVLYYSPVSMGGSTPKWDFSLLEEVSIPGVNSARFKFYAYKTYKKKEAVVINEEQEEEGN